MIEKQAYAELVSKNAPKSKHFSSIVRAFIVGGIICCIGQGFFDLFSACFPYLLKDDISSIVTLTMIFLGALLTGVGIYDDIGNFSGAGSIVPITGFANSIVAPAMEFKKEGIVLGICAKMFVIAGPIIVLGIFSATLVGILYWIF